MLGCRTSCARDNIDSLGSITIKVILVDRKLVTNSLDPILDSNIAIYLAV